MGEWPRSALLDKQTKRRGIALPCACEGATVKRILNLERWPQTEIPHSRLKMSFNHAVASSASCCSKIMQFVATIALSMSS